jgi:tetratricopeptide (TPR) repeat protein
VDSTPARAAPTVSNRLITVALIVASLAPFAGTLSFGYVMDDTTAIRSNPDMDGWDSLWKVWAHGYGGGRFPFFGLYRPVTMAVFAFVWNAGGHWPLWFHLLAISMHAITTVLVWRLLVRAVGRNPATLAALWFAVHPVHVEAVANVANSSETLVAIWTCALALYLRRLDDRHEPISWAQALTAGVLYLAAFLSKESGAVAPVLAALWVWGGRRPQMPSAGAGAPALANRWWRVGVSCGAAAVVVLTLRSFVLGGPVTGESIAIPGLVELSAFERVRAMLSLGPKILRLLVWPVMLNPHYGPTSFPASSNWLALATVSVLAVATSAAIRLAKRGDRRLFVAIAWTAIAFFPASNLLVATGQILAERTLYVPSIGIALLIAWTLDALWMRAAVHRRWRITRTAVVVATALLIAVAAIRTARWNEVWRSHPALFAQMIAADSASYRGYWLSALEARTQRRMDESLALFARAHRLFPDDRGLMIDYSETLSASGQPARAAAIAKGLISSSRHRARPRDIALYLDAIHQAYGPDSLVAASMRLMRQQPSATAALFLGYAHERRGEKAAAMEAYRDGLRASPGDSALQLRLRILGIAK